MEEHGSSKPLVGGSSPSRGTNNNKCLHSSIGRMLEYESRGWEFESLWGY